jgi:hypothetical protein
MLEMSTVLQRVVINRESNASEQCLESLVA